MNVLANLQEKLYQSDLNEKDYAYWQEQFFAEYFRLKRQRNRCINLVLWRSVSIYRKVHFSKGEHGDGRKEADGVSVH